MLSIALIIALIALRSKGIPEKIIAIIKDTYNGAKWRVLYKGKLCKPFEVHSGVRQGYILMWTMNSFLQHLGYADDICILSHKILDVLSVPWKKRRHPQV